MTDPVADVARSAAVILALELGTNLPAEVEVALHARSAGERRPSQYDPLAIAGVGIGAASLIVSITQLAWSIVGDRRKRIAEQSPDAIAREARIMLRQQDIPISPGTDHIANVVITEIIRLKGPHR